MSVQTQLCKGSLGKHAPRLPRGSCSRATGRVAWLAIRATYMYALVLAYRSNTEVKSVMLRSREAAGQGRTGRGGGYRTQDCNRLPTPHPAQPPHPGPQP